MLNTFYYLCIWLKTVGKELMLDVLLVFGNTHRPGAAHSISTNHVKWLKNTHPGWIRSYLVLISWKRNSIYPLWAIPSYGLLYMLIAYQGQKGESIQTEKHFTLSFMILKGTRLIQTHIETPQTNVTWPPLKVYFTQNFSHYFLTFEMFLTRMIFFFCGTQQTKM